MLTYEVANGNVTNKSDLYAALVNRRKQCKSCSGLTNPAELPGDSEHIGPWTRWQGRLSARLMVVGQDWGDTKYFQTNKGRESASNPTNEKLRQLLASVGVTIDVPSACGQRQVCYFTNAVLCLKARGLQARVRNEWFENCGGFLKRQVDLVAPKVVVTLGERAFRSVLSAYGLRGGRFRDEVAAPGMPLPNGALLVPVYHCGMRILNSHRNWQQQQADWRRVQIALGGSMSAKE